MIQLSFKNGYTLLIILNKKFAIILPAVQLLLIKWINLLFVPSFHFVHLFVFLDLALLDIDEFLQMGHLLLAADMLNFLSQFLLKPKYIWCYFTFQFTIEVFSFLKYSEFHSFCNERSLFRVQISFRWVTWDCFRGGCYRFCRSSGGGALGLLRIGLGFCAWCYCLFIFNLILIWDLILWGLFF